MSQRIRIGNTYWHRTREEEVFVCHRDASNHVWFRGVVARDNAGVISTSDWVDQQPYKEFLGVVEMRDYPPDPEWEARRQAILERDGNTCQGCGDEGSPLQVHHIVPLGAGGTNAKSNLIALCEQCHGRVHGGVT